MSLRILLPITVSVIAGLGCLVVLNNVMKDANRPGQEIETGLVVVAAQNLQELKEIEETMLRVERRPADVIPEKAFTDIAQVTGRVLKTPVPAKFAITEMFLAPEGTPPGLAGKIPTGYRAQAIKVDEWSGVAGFIEPGSHVDVISTIRNQRHKKTKAQTILKNVKVIAVGQTMSSPNREEDGRSTKPERSVTLLLLPGQVETVLAHEANGGRLSLTLRSGGTEAGDSMTDLTHPPAQTDENPAEMPQTPKFEKKIVLEVNGDRSEPVLYIRELPDGEWQRETESGSMEQMFRQRNVALPQAKARTESRGVTE